MNFIERIEDVSELKSLEVFKMTGNRLQEIDSMRGLESLRAFYVQNNRITNLSLLPNYELDRLEILHLSKNCIPLSELDSTVKSVLLMTSLKELFLFDNEIAKD